VRRTINRLVGPRAIPLAARTGLMAAIMAAMALLAVGARAEAPRQPEVTTDADPLAGAAVATDNPEATKAAWTALRQGGSAVDAAIAAAFVMTVTMPESASIGGAGAALRYDAESRHISAYVGREIAGAAASPDWMEAPEGRQPPPLEGGRSVGAPTLLRMLGALHDEAGRLGWAALTVTPERLARAGFPLTPRAAAALARVYLPVYGGADEIFGQSGDRAAEAGALVRNPRLADVFLAIGQDGPMVLAGGVAGHAITRLVEETSRYPATLALDELSRAEPIVAPPVCAALAKAALCAPPAPTIGPIAVETAALFEAAAPETPSARDWANVMAQAHRLAMADARRYLGDPQVFPDLTPDLVTPEQIARRVRSISLERDRGLPGAGRLRGAPTGLVSAPPMRRRPPTASVVVVDGRGDAVALSLTLTQPYGSGLAARGVVLNAANDAFDPPVGAIGRMRANEIRAHARPRLDLTPMMALDGERRLILAAAGAGGDEAPAFLAKAVLAVLKFGKSAAAAVAAPNVSSAGRATVLEALTQAERLQGPLEDIGHKTLIRPMPSGLVLIVAGPAGPDAAADPRGPGDALSQPSGTALPLDLGKRGS